MSLKRLVSGCEPIFIAKMVFEVDLSVESGFEVVLRVQSANSKI